MTRVNIVLIAVLLCSVSSWAQDADVAKIKENIRAFSQAYMDGDYDKLANSYTIDGRILPPGPLIISGREAIKKRWMLPEGARVLLHAVTPEEINVIGDYAYDVGYYEGKTRRANGEESSWRGKYLIVWKRVGDDWKIHIDAWNAVSDN